MEIKHCCHEHPLILSETQCDNIVCDGCFKDFSGQTYSCNQCSFFLHRSCSQLPSEIKCFLHRCSLTLQLGSHGKDIINCYGCRKIHKGFYYHCRPCQFTLGAECALQPPLIPAECALQPQPGPDDPLQILHFCHEHPLALIQNFFNQIGCEVCRLPCSDMESWGCEECNMFFHNSCIDKLPQKLHHFFHPCLLVLVSTMSDFTCSVCHNPHSGLRFRCGDCEFNLDVECALLSTMKDQGVEQIEHFSHGHPLKFHNSVEEYGRARGFFPACSVCGLEFDSGSFYFCERCHFYMHNTCHEFAIAGKISCSKLPRQIKHPSHPIHPLTIQVLTNYISSPMWPPLCAVCEEETRGFFYGCSTCRLSLHIGCATLKPSVKFGDHGHLLILFQDTRMQRFCEICRRQCNGFHLLCVECRINFHLHCHPSMPRIIKHRCHVDPLSFTELPVPDDLKPDDEFYCDVCESLRDPKDPVYYCAECDFVAHVDCVISEVLPQIMENASATEEMGDHILAGLDKETWQFRAWEEGKKKLLKSMEDERQYLEEKKKSNRRRTSVECTICRDNKPIYRVSNKKFEGT